MPAPTLPLEAKEAPEAPEESSKAATPERRESERLIIDWQEEMRHLGQALALMTLDVSAMKGPKWAYRFIVAVNPIVEKSSLLFYGAGFASLLSLPETADRFLPMVAQLPARYVPVFTRGCIASTLSGAAVRMHGAVEREDGAEELYRAAFMRLNLDANRDQQVALGAFSYRVAERQT